MRGLERGTKGVRIRHSLPYYSPFGAFNSVYSVMEIIAPAMYAITHHA